MKNELLFILCIFLFIPFIKAQNNFFIGTKSYQTTNAFTGTIKHGYPDICNAKYNSVLSTDGSATVSIGKNGKAGYLIISVCSYEPLIGDVIVYLEDGNAIKCKDRGVKDRYDNLSIGVYNLTPNEITLLKNSDIFSIRASIKTYGTERHSFNIILDVLTAAEINLLF